MKNRKNQYKTILILLGILFCFAIFIDAMIKESKNITYSNDYVTRDEVATLLSFTYYSEKEWSQILEKNVSSKITYEDISFLQEQLGVQDYIEAHRETGKAKISRKEWFELYDQIVEILDVNNTITYKSLIILGDHKSMKSLKKNHLFTNEGIYQNQLPYVELMKENQYEYVLWDGKMIGMKAVSDEDVVLPNVWVKQVANGEIDLLYQKENIIISQDSLEQTITNTLCDITFQQNKVITISKKEDIITGKVLAIHENDIEIEGYGIVPFSEQFHIYKIYDEIEEQDISKLVIGNILVDFIVADGKVCAGLLKQPMEIETIRVLLLNGEQNLFHPQVEITSDAVFEVSNGNGSIQYQGGEVLTITQEDGGFANGYFTIKSLVDGGKIKVSSLQRACGVPQYEGVIEVRKEGNGLSIINAISLERYLYGVLPSEMPASYELEALKAQAVCARSYAYQQLLKNSYAQYGAHVDDSTNYQVYNNIEQNEATTKAVNDTMGEVAMYQEQVIEAYYFSTSCGRTSDMGVWGQMVTPENAYLQPVTVAPQKQELDLSTEEAFVAFLNNGEIGAYEADQRYYRWSTVLKIYENQEAIKNRLAHPTDIGDITDICIKKRNKGGAIEHLSIQGTLGAVELTSENKIRKVLAACGGEISTSDKKVTAMTSLLPSAYFQIVPIYENGVLQQITLNGGGHGHGIGMSQNGANAMAKVGLPYAEILKTFYNGIELSYLYQ